MLSLIVIMLALLSLVLPALGNRVFFINKDSVDRHICWYPGSIPGSDPVNPEYFPHIASTFVPAYGRGVTDEIVHGGSYMFKSIYDGGRCEDMHNVEGEFTFNGMNNRTFFNLSVVKNNDNGFSQPNHQIHFLRDATAMDPQSGCVTFPCENVYQFHNDNLKQKDTNKFDLTAIICNGACSAD